MISVEQTGPQQWLVTVGEDPVTTHEVAVPEAYYRRLTGGDATVEELLTRSFEFLLERESNTSILRRFELPVIGRYFPEYETVIAGRVKK